MLLQMSLLKHNRRLKQRDSLPLNAVRGSGGSEAPTPSVVQEDSSSGSGPQKLKLFAHLYLLF